MPRIIKDSDGIVVRCCRGMSGIRKYAVDHGVREIQIDILNGFWLTAFFGNATYCRTRFENYRVMIDVVSRWRAAQGAAFIMNKEKLGTVNEKTMARACL